MKGMVTVMKDCTSAVCHHHAANCYYFESMLKLILVLWLIKWLYADSHLGGYHYERTGT